MDARMAEATVGQEGCRALGVGELVALVLDESTVEEGYGVLERAKGLTALATMSRQQVMATCEVDALGATRLLAAFELGRRACAAEHTEPLVTDPAALAGYVRARLGAQEQECLCVISVDAHMRVVDCEVVYRGQIAEMPIRIAEVLRAPLRAGAYGFALAHNHPSGDVHPSEGDLYATATIARLAKEIGLELLDHIIVGPCAHTSLRAAHVLDAC